MPIGVGLGLGVGLARGAAGEPSRTNAFIYSEQFDNAVWVKSATTVTPNAIAGPTGTATADKIIEAATSANHYIYQLQDFTAGQFYAFSVYAKAGERDDLRFVLPATAFGTAASWWFSLNDGIAARSTAGTSDSGYMTALADGWYRCVMIAQATATVAAALTSIRLATGTGGLSYLGDGTSGLYLWGAQNEQGATASSYIETTAAPVTR